VTPEQYITSNKLWDLAGLKEHAQTNSVYVIESVRFPNVVMLHYQDSCTWDNTWNTFARMSRGLILDMKNRKVLAYPFDKFFNLGQMPETSYDNLVSLGEFQTSEKLDGSLIITFLDPNTDTVTFTTKGSFDSEHGKYANELPLTFEQEELLRDYTLKGTLMFELVTKRFQIVIDYAKKGYPEGLYPIGYKHHVSNKLASFHELAIMAEKLKMPTFKTYSFSSLDQLIETAKGLPVLDEGFVLRFPADIMVKVKGSAYLAAHRFISHLSDRNILEAVSDGTAPNLATLAPEEYRREVLDKITYFQKRVAQLEKECYTWFEKAPKEGPRKEYAAWVIKNVPAHLKGFLFSLLDGKQVDRKQMFKVLGEIEHVDGRTKI
jgi:RNA ligase